MIAKNVPRLSGGPGYNGAFDYFVRSNKSSEQNGRFIK